MFNVVFGNGLLYYMYLFTIAVINVIVSETTPSSLKLVLVLIYRVSHAIFGCRAVLDIRAEISDMGIVVVDSSLRTETFPSGMET